jgi:hypothetical protein
MDGIKEMEGKRVYIETVSRRKYTGTIISVDIDLKFLSMQDKYGEKVWIAFSDIKLLQEERR